MPGESTLGIRSAGALIRHLAFVLFVLVCALALTGPLFAPIQQSAPPLVGGLPFSLLWVVGWVLASFTALLLYHLTGRQR